jgi:hypothetical protein
MGRTKMNKIKTWVNINEPISKLEYEQQLQISIENNDIDYKQWLHEEYQRQQPILDQQQMDETHEQIQLYQSIVSTPPNSITIPLQTNTSSTPSNSTVTNVPSPSIETPTFTA